MNINAQDWSRLIDRTFTDEQQRSSLRKTSFLKPYEIAESDVTAKSKDNADISEKAKNLARLKITSENWIG
ncbi:MAG: hypothetical protein V1720_04495 [bacterium]